MTRIAPAGRFPLPKPGELIASRELLSLLTWRDITVRYKQTLLGASWAILQPVLTMLVFSVFFGGIAKIPSEGVPYPVFTLAALVPWTFFSNGLQLGSNSLVTNASLITKIYFPRILMPLATLLAGLLDLLVAFVVLLGVMGWYGIAPKLSILWIPYLILITVLATSGITVWLAALNVRYRDVRYVLPFLSQLWLLFTPIAYPTSLISSSRWRVVMGLNPMAGVVEGFRSALLPVRLDALPIVTVSSLSALVFFCAGTIYFYRVERTFADVV